MLFVRRPKETKFAANETWLTLMKSMQPEFIEYQHYLLVSMLPSDKIVLKYFMAARVKKTVCQF